MITRSSRTCRFAAVLAATVLAGPALGAQVLTAAPDPTAASTPTPVPPTPAIAAAQARVLTTQDMISTDSAELAGVRTALSSADPGQVAALTAQQARLENAKNGLITTLASEQRTLNDLIAAQAQAAAAAAATASTLSLGTTLATPLGTAAGPIALPPPGPTAAAIDAFLGPRQSPLTGLGAVFVADGEADGVDPRLLVAISGAETSFGTYGPAQAIHNPFGLGPNLVFPSWAAAIQAAANTLGGPLYRGSGLVTIDAIQARWAPLRAANDPLNLNSNWRAAVTQFFADLGGNPSGPVIGGGTAQVVSLTPTAPAPGTDGPAAAKTAMTLIGVPNSADTPNGLSDTQLVQTVYQDGGVQLPATVDGLWHAGTSVAALSLRAGDAVFFSANGNGVDHVGLYLGGGEFIHAPGPGQVIQIASLYDAPWSASYAGARRY